LCVNAPRQTEQRRKKKGPDKLFHSTVILARFRKSRSALVNPATNREPENLGVQRGGGGGVEEARHGSSGVQIHAEP